MYFKFSFFLSSQFPNLNIFDPFLPTPPSPHHTPPQEPFQAKAVASKDPKAEQRKLCEDLGKQITERAQAAIKQKKIDRDEDVRHATVAREKYVFFFLR